MLETTIKEIDGHQFEITQLPFGRARRVLVRLSKEILPVLVTAMNGQADPQLLATALREGLAQVSDADLEFYAEEFGHGSFLCQPDGKKPRLDRSHREIVFGGKLLMFFKWLYACVEVNFADFFTEFSNLSAPGLSEEVPGA